MMVLVTILCLPAHAWDWGYNWSQASSATYHIRVQDFTTQEIFEIEKGAKAWNAGSGEILRGATHEFVRGSDATALVGLQNTQNEVFTKPRSWFSNRFLGNAIAVMVPTPLPFIAAKFETDIVFATDVAFCTAIPSNASCDGKHSMGQVATHEFGHMAGFEHEDDRLATMNSSSPNAGELGAAKYRIHEDDAKGMMVKYSGSSTGRNLMLSKYKRTAAGDSAELWRGDVVTYQKSRAAWLGGFDPDPVRAVHTGTGTTTSLVEWRLANGPCSPGSGHLVGSRTITMSTNVPYAVNPTSWDFSSVPVGSYRMCVSIDPFDTVTETWNSDNSVWSRSSDWLEVEW